MVIEKDGGRQRREERREEEGRKKGGKKEGKKGGKVGSRQGGRQRETKNGREGSSAYYVHSSSTKKSLGVHIPERSLGPAGVPDGVLR